MTNKGLDFHISTAWHSTTADDEYGLFKIGVWENRGDDTQHPALNKMLVRREFALAYTTTKDIKTVWFGRAAIKEVLPTLPIGVQNFIEGSSWSR